MRAVPVRRPNEALRRGRLAYPDFVETVVRLVPMYWARVVGGTLYIAGVVMCCLNAFMTWRARPATYADSVGEAPALAPGYVDVEPPSRLRAEGAMVADLADYSEWKNHRRATAIIFSAILCGLKVGLSVGGALVAGILAHYGLVVTPIDDTMLLSYVLNGASHGHGMDELAQRYLDHDCITYESLCGKGAAQIGFASCPIGSANWIRKWRP